MPKAKKGERFGGRQKGAQNKVTASLKEMILASLDEVGGQSYLVDQARNNPNAYITLIGKVLPTTLASDKDNPISAPVFQLVVSNDK
jgi:hypothetical protein|tara:strand:- start:976 stop:1236 length:261 start_codon:yes stop_codon:yes gene_type:complete